MSLVIPLPSLATRSTRLVTTRSAASTPAAPVGRLWAMPPPRRLRPPTVPARMDRPGRRLRPTGHRSRFPSPPWCWCSEPALRPRWLAVRANA